MADVKRTYLNHVLSGSFSAVSGFMKNRLKYKDKTQVESELRKLRGFALHKPIRRKFKRTPIKILFLGETWSCDLRDVQNIAAYNNCNRYVLCCVDNFSKYAYTSLLKDKTAESMIKAFKRIFREAAVRPTYLFTDAGSEFKSKAFQDFLKENGVMQYNIYSHMKASICERFIR